MNRYLIDFNATPAPSRDSVRGTYRVAGLVDTAHVAAGQRVPIHGSGGGVGHLAVQIAKARGAEVIGTANVASTTS